jgi:hypothetical protein
MAATAVGQGDQSQEIFSACSWPSWSLKWCFFKEAKVSGLS